MARLNIHAIFVFILLLVAVNILLLDIVVFTQKDVSEPVSTSVSTNQDQSCADDCERIITQKVREAMSLQSVKPTESSPVISGQTKEFYIPLGVGTTRGSEYQELLGAEAYIDSQRYPNITQVTFEVFLRNPTGNGRVYAKLFDVTDKHDVWFSEVFMEGSDVTRKEATIHLENGNKLYRIMLKSTLSYDAYVDQARVKIVTQ